MVTRLPKPIHTAEIRGPKPRIFNRPWHLDADERRHHGRRRWDPAAVEALLELASTIDCLYPPDFSHRDTIRFRAAGASRPLAELRTSNPAELRLLLVGFTEPVTPLRKTLGLPVRKTRRGAEVMFQSTEQVAGRAFEAFFRGYVNT